MEKINNESIQNLAVLIFNIIRAEPPKLTEFDFCRLGGSAEQGQEILEALYDTRLQIKLLDISENPSWAEFEDYSNML